MKNLILILLCLITINMGEVNAQNSDTGTVFFLVGNFGKSSYTVIGTDIYKVCGNWKDWDYDGTEDRLKSYIRNNHYINVQEENYFWVHKYQWGPDKEYKTYQEAYLAAQDMKTNGFKSSPDIEITRSDVNLDVNPSECGTGSASSGGDESASGNRDGNWGWVRMDPPTRYTDKKVSLSKWEKNVWSVDGEWKSLPCYKGIDVRVRRSKSNKTSLILDEVYLWQVVFRNRYSRKVVFSYSITDLRPTSASDGDEDSSSGGRGYETKTLYSKEYGELDDFYYDYYARHNTYTTDEESIYILIKDLRFDSSSVYYYGADGSEYGEGEYEPCDR